jgi:hypothetical protein
VTDVPPPTSPSRRRRVLRMTGIVVVNVLLIAIIVGLLVATWLPAYVYRHDDVTIGESHAK